MACETIRRTSYIHSELQHKLKESEAFFTRTQYSSCVARLEIVPLIHFSIRGMVKCCLQWSFLYCSDVGCIIRIGDSFSEISSWYLANYTAANSTNLFQECWPFALQQYSVYHSTCLCPVQRIPLLIWMSKMRSCQMKTKRKSDIHFKESTFNRNEPAS